MLPQVLLQYFTGAVDAPARDNGVLSGYVLLAGIWSGWRNNTRVINSVAYSAINR
jgi:hypothetical protein